MIAEIKIVRALNRKQVIKFICAGFTLLFTACVYDPVYYGPPPYPEFQPHYYDYYFYPSASVYFQFSTGNYYYRDRGIWVKSRALPPTIPIDARDRVRIRVENDRPNLKYNDHIRSYKPKPEYRVDKERSVKERRANERWYEEYQQKQSKSGRKDKDKDILPINALCCARNTHLSARKDN